MKKVILIFGTVSALLISCETAKPALDSSPIQLKSNSDAALMTQVQKDVLKYFWEYAEPNSMLARERYHEDNIYPQND